MLWVEASAFRLIGVLYVLRQLVFSLPFWLGVNCYKGYKSQLRPILFGWFWKGVIWNWAKMGFQPSFIWLTWKHREKVYTSLIKPRNFWTAIPVLKKWWKDLQLTIIRRNKREKGLPQCCLCFFLAFKISRNDATACIPVSFLTPKGI